MGRLRLFTSLLLTVTLFAACGNSETTTTGTDGSNPSGTGSDGTGGDAVIDPADLSVGSWVLQTGRGPTGEVPVLDSHPITLTVEAESNAGTGSVGGVSACNRYGGTFSLDETSFALAEVAGTQMACLPDEAMAAELAYLQALSDVSQIAFDGDRLTLSGPDSELVFAAEAPVPDAELLGQVWLLDTVIDGATVSTVLGDEALLQFNDDGTFVGGTGCRELRGEYLITGSEVQFPSFEAVGECPEELAAQDSLVISVLEGGFTVEIAEQRLTVLNEPEGLSYRAVEG
jgi:heat shock protein HslJ